MVKITLMYYSKQFGKKIPFIINLKGQRPVKGRKLRVSVSREKKKHQLSNNVHMNTK